MFLFLEWGGLEFFEGLQVKGFRILLKHNILQQVSKKNQELSFYSIPEFEEWKSSTEGSKSWKVKYYKGLGTSTPKEAKEYFADMDRHRITFSYDGLTCDEAILMVSVWLMSYLVLLLSGIYIILWVIILELRSLAQVWIFVSGF